jgi:N-methylhydantoinase A
LFSSFGLLYAGVEHHYTRTLRRLLRKADLGEVQRAWDALARQALDQLAAEGFKGERAQLRRSAALHYHGQTYELTVPMKDGPVDASAVAYLEEAFGTEHERTYGHRAGPEEPVELVAIQVVGQGLREGESVPERVRSSRPEAQAPAPRRAYFGPEAGWLETPVLRRADLAKRQDGPLIIEEYDATCVIPPRATAELDAGGNILIGMANNLS